MHELVISVQFPEQEDSVPKVISDKEYKTEIEFIHKESLEEMNAAETLITISDLIVPPRGEVMITFGIAKSMMQFEQYPNDPARGFNIQHMPVLYREVTMRKETFKSDEEERSIVQVEVEGSGDYSSVYSQSMLVQIPEPDFSMPFNVNAVTQTTLGIFMINMYNILVKPKRFSE